MSASTQNCLDREREREGGREREGVGEETDREREGVGGEKDRQTDRDKDRERNGHSTDQWNGRRLQTTSTGQRCRCPPQGWPYSGSLAGSGFGSTWTRWEWRWCAAPEAAPSCWNGWRLRCTSRAAAPLGTSKDQEKNQSWGHLRTGREVRAGDI